VAVRKNQKPSRGSQAVVIFWLVFIIVVIGIFLANREAIERNFDLLKRRLTSAPVQEELPLTVTEEKGGEGADETPPDVTIVEEPAETEPAETEPTETGPGVTEPGAESQPPAQNTQPPVPAQPPRTQDQPQPPKPAETRDRNIYFTQIDNDGQILRSRVIRKIAVSDNPMQDALNALLAGPTPEESNRGIISLIPSNTRILSTFIRGSTAYISFNEDFQFNTYGVEGYAGQIRQIVWTVTEFPTVSDVQILIEGKRIDYLGEGIWIGSPVNRDSL
jgi:spore germination protein GerM